MVLFFLSENTRKLPSSTTSRFIFLSLIFVMWIRAYSATATKECMKYFNKLFYSLFGFRFSVLVVRSLVSLLFPLFLHPMKQIFPLSVLNTNYNQQWQSETYKKFLIFVHGSSSSFVAVDVFAILFALKIVFVIRKRFHFLSFLFGRMLFAQTFANVDDDDDEGDNSDGSLKIFYQCFVHTHIYFPLRINKSWHAVSCNAIIYLLFSLLERTQNVAGCIT